MNLQEAFKIAKQLPTHSNGLLNPHYKMISEINNFSNIIYTEIDSPVSIFEELGYRTNSVERYYIKTFVTYREDGTKKPKHEWLKKLYFHKKWSRIDLEVKSITYDIVGFKRSTSQLPAGVLISNVKFNL